MFEVEFPEVELLLLEQENNLAHIGRVFDVGGSATKRVLAGIARDTQPILLQNFPVDTRAGYAAQRLDAGDDFAVWYTDPSATNPKGGKRPTGYLPFAFIKNDFDPYDELANAVQDIAAERLIDQFVIERSTG